MCVFECGCMQVTVIVLCLFWVGLQCVIVAFPGHAYFFYIMNITLYRGGSRISGTGVHIHKGVGGSVG